MALLNILKNDDPGLRKICKPVTSVTPRVIRLLDDMADTLHKANGCGLAAPQVGVLRRIVIVEAVKGELIELINPEIIEAVGEQNEAEGCLSLPGKWGITNRPERVVVRAFDRNGDSFTVEGTELLARALCHEIDHLNGILYIDKAIRMLDPEDFEEE